MRLDTLARLPSDGIAFDTETYPIRAGLLAPRLVCASVAELRQDAGRIVGELLDEHTAIWLYKSLLRTERQIISGANMAFDLAVMSVRLAEDGVDAMPATFAALCDHERIYDVQIAQALDAVAEGCLDKDPRTGGPLINPETGRRGRYSLATVVDLVLGRKDAKVNDEWRKAYGELHPYPIALWPQVARDYPVDDAVNTAEVTFAQAGFLPRIGAHRWGPGSACEWCGLTPQQSFVDGQVLPCRAQRRNRNLHDLSNQVGTAFAMHLGALWGFAVNQEAVDIVEADALDGREEAMVPFIEAGLIRRNKDGTTSRDMSQIARRVALAYGARTDAPCATCKGTCKVPSTKNPKSKINCKACAATGLDLSVSPHIPKTETERIGSGRDVMQESGDETLMVLADHQENSKVLETYVPFFRRARTPIAGHVALCPSMTDEKGTCSCEGPYRPIPLTLWPNVLLETGRTSYGGVVQQLPRKPGHKNGHGSWIPSLRETIVAREGCVFSSEDFESGELVTHGQSCIWITGDSELAKALVAGIKVHNALGASMIGLSYDEFQRMLKTGDVPCKDARQAAKPGNFGFPGGMGPAKMVLTQRKQGPDTPCANGPTWIHVEGSDEKVRGYKGLRFCILMDGAERCGIEIRHTFRDKPIAPTCAACLSCAVRLKETWISQWPENVEYFAFINACINDGMIITGAMLEMWPHLQGVYYPGQQLAPGEVMQHVSGRIRGGTDYCAASNGFFQGLLADAAKSALRRISRECYDRTVRVPDMAHENSIVSRYAGGTSPLFGSHVIVFQHDEVVLEHPEDLGHDGAMRASELMRDELRHFCPDLAPACRAEPTLMKRLMKGATPWWRRGGKEPADANDTLVPWEPSS